jgi:hypothetical protein
VRKIGDLLLKLGYYANVFFLLQVNLHVHTSKNVRPSNQQRELRLLLMLDYDVLNACCIVDLNIYVVL